MSGNATKNFTTKSRGGPMTDETPEPHPQISRGGGSVDGIQTVTGSTFQPLVLEGKGPMVVEFMSYGCAHCRVMEPVLQQVAEMVEPKEKIFRVNIALEQELADSYQIEGTPTFVMFLNGTEVGRVEGPPPKVASVLAMVTEPFKS
jgi:thioredoxin 1